MHLHLQQQTNTHKCMQLKNKFLITVKFWLHLIAQTYQKVFWSLTHIWCSQEYFVCKFLPRMFVGSRILFRSPFTKDQEDICFLLVFEGDATASPIPTAAVSRLIWFLLSPPFPNHKLHREFYRFRMLHLLMQYTKCILGCGSVLPKQIPFYI